MERACLLCLLCLGGKGRLFSTFFFFSLLPFGFLLSPLLFLSPPFPIF